jgi:hypothetical protein
MVSVVVNIIVVVVIVSTENGPHNLSALIEVENPRLIVGEPLIVDFIVRNDGATNVCSPPHLDFETGRISFSLHARQPNGRVFKWNGHGAGCTKGIGDILILQNGGCRTVLSPGRELRSRKLVVFLELSEEHGFAQPLETGQYELIGVVPWGENTLQTLPIAIDVFDARDPSDRGASRLVDNAYAQFCDSGILGMADLDPTGSVARILDEFERSVHARLATSRLLALRAERLSGTYGVSEEQRRGWRNHILETLARIDEHLQARPGDALELELMDGKVQLLRRLELIEQLQSAVGALIEKYPGSARAERAREMMRQLRESPKDNTARP